MCMHPNFHVPYLFGNKKGFLFSRMTTNNKFSPMKLCYDMSLSNLNDPKDLDPFYKTGLDFWDCFGREKILHLITEETWY